MCQVGHGHPREKLDHDVIVDHGWQWSTMVDNQVTIVFDLELSWPWNRLGDHDLPWNDHEIFHVFSWSHDGHMRTIIWPWMTTKSSWSLHGQMMVTLMTMIDHELTVELFSEEVLFDIRRPSLITDKFWREQQGFQIFTWNWKICMYAFQIWLKHCSEWT